MTVNFNYRGTERRKSNPEMDIFLALLKYHSNVYLSLHGGKMENAFVRDVKYWHKSN